MSAPLFLTRFLVLALALLPGISLPVLAADPTAAFQAFLEDFDRATLNRDPTLRTIAGGTKDNDRWTDFSDRKFDEDVAFYLESLRRLQTDFDLDRLSEQAQFDYRVLEYDLESRIERDRWRYHLPPINQIVGLHLEIPNVLTTYHRLDSVGDAEAYVARLQAAAKPLGGLVAFLEERQRRGIHYAAGVVPLLIDGARNAISGAPFDDGPENVLLVHFRQKLEGMDLGEGEQEVLLDRAVRAMREDLQPAYQRLIDTLEAEREMSQSNEGAWQHPNGDRYYAYLLRQFNNIDITPAETHAIGLEHVEIARRNIREEMVRLGIEGDFADLVAFLKDSPEQRYENSDAGRRAYLADMNAIAARMLARTGEIVSDPPDIGLVIRRHAPYREPAAPAFYEAGLPDGSRPGTLYLNLSDMSGILKYRMEPTIFHELSPGHHLQVSIGLTSPLVPTIRTYYVWWTNSSFTEGWASYATHLAQEMGAYTGEYSRLGQYLSDLNTAARLVADTGLHAMRWTPERVLDYLAENGTGTEQSNRFALARFNAVPGQATVFLVGKVRILAARAKAQAALGHRFDLRAFHDTLLEQGQIPMWAAEERVDAWVAAELLAAD